MLVLIKQGCEHGLHIYSCLQTKTIGQGDSMLSECSPVHMVHIHHLVRGHAS